MLGKIVINSLLLLGLLLASPARAQIGDIVLPDDLGLPAGVVNTALPEFGKFPMAGDYGLGNATPVETVGMGQHAVGGGTHQQIRIFRSPPLRLDRRKYKANMQVLLGDVKGVYVWVETPPSQGHWRMGVDVLYQDGTRRTLFGKDMNRNDRDWVFVEPNTRLDIEISSKTRAIKVNREFIVAVSPGAYWARYPGYLPIPYKTYFP